MTDAGHDMWANAPKFPIRYLVTLTGSDRVTLARSRAHDKPVDVAAAFAAPGGVVEFTEGVTRTSEIADLERVDELTYQAFVQGGGEVAGGEDSDVSDWTNDQIRDAADALQKCESRTFDQSMELARLSGILAARQRAKGVTT